MSKLKKPSREAPWGISPNMGNSVVTQDDNSLVKYVELNITERCEGGCITCPTTTSYGNEKKVKREDDLKSESDMFKGMLRKLKGFGLDFLTIYGSSA